jgi:predicted alpha/beta-fold hydrolase
VRYLRDQTRPFPLPGYHPSPKTYRRTAVYRGNRQLLSKQAFDIMRVRQQHTRHGGLVGFLDDQMRPQPLPGYHPSPKTYRRTVVHRGNRQLLVKQAFDIMRVRQQHTRHGGLVGFLDDQTRPQPLPGYHPSPKTYRRTVVHRGNRQLLIKQAFDIMRVRRQHTRHGGLVGFLGDQTRPLRLPGHHPSPKAYRQ